MDNSPGGSVFLDGDTNVRRVVDLRLGIALEIIEDGQVIASWPWRSIRRVDWAGKGIRLRSTAGAELARLEIADTALGQSVVDRSPDYHLGLSVGTRHAGRIITWSLAAAASIAFVGIIGVPYAADRIAPLLPQSFDARLGAMVDSQVKLVFGDKKCVSPEGKAAFDKILEALKRGGQLQAPVDAAILDSKIKNAIALPGGKVYFFKGLLEKTQSADELAGILAHELGHVHHRDGMRKMLQAGGSSYLLGLLFGDVGGAGAVILATRVLLDKSYTRKAEYRADSYAIETMNRLGRSAAPMGELLVRVTGKQSQKKTSILASHPFSEDRLARMKKSVPANPAPPLLTDTEWASLKRICDSVRSDKAG